MKKLILMLLLVPCAVWAQPGPTVVCHNCDGAMNKPHPVSGSWYNPDQSGSGYILEIQKGYLWGYYFGYDNDGNALWLNFQGPLLEGDGTSDVTWHFDSTMKHITGGNAINQPHQAPTIEDTGDQVKIDFISMHNARITVNDGQTQNIVPLVFGVHQEPVFEESEKVFPDLEGVWNFTYKKYRPEFTYESQGYLYSGDVFFINQMREFINDDVTTVKYGVYKDYWYPPYESLGVGEIICSNPTDPDDGLKNLQCKLKGFPATPLGFDYLPSGPDEAFSMVIPIGDLGAFQFSAEFIDPEDPEHGFTIEATRVNNWQPEG